jgi:hypothetical protein
MSLRLRIQRTSQVSTIGKTPDEDKQSQSLLEGKGKGEL